MRNKDPKRENHKQKKIKSSWQKEKQSKLDNWYDEIDAYLDKQTLNAIIYFLPDVFLSSIYSQSLT